MEFNRPMKEVEEAPKDPKTDKMIEAHLRERQLEKFREIENGKSSN